ncbi:MAG: tetratricopeptide repeat protein [Desulfobulbaceae bacterium]|nr:tetratricopeptide repeat protein [Desulfobulbaceae bacterium]
MGNKSGRSWKYILYYIAVSCIIAANTVACAPVQNRIAEGRAERQLEQYREDLAAGSFAEVIGHARETVAENETEPAAELAFYALGKAYANHDYAGRDYALSRHYFEKLIENFPESRLSSEAETFISLFEIIDAKEKAAAAACPEVEAKTTAAFPGEQPHTVILPPKRVEDKNFEEAANRNQQILTEIGNKKPADEVLYNLGLIYAHTDNPAKDYKKSQIYFHVLAKQFPDSELAEEARIWLGLFETIEKMQQIDIEIEQQKKKLTH